MANYSSYSEYVFSSNLKLLLAIVAGHHLCTIFNLPLFNQVLRLKLVQLLEFIVVLRCILNMWNTTKPITNPYINKLKAIPFVKYIKGTGPITTAFYNVLKYIFVDYAQTSKTVPKNTPIPINNTTMEKEVKPAVLSFDLSKGSAETLYPLSTTVDQNKDTIFDPINSTTSTSNVKFGMSSGGINNNVSFGSTSQAGYMPSYNISSFKYVEAVASPVDVKIERARCMWYLSPTPDVIEDLRVQQLVDFKNTWKLFTDDVCRVYNERLTSALLNHIFVPLVKSIEEFEGYLGAVGYKLSTATANVIGLSVASLPATGKFKITDIEKFINIDGYCDKDGRQYVIDRLKNFVYSTKIARYLDIPFVKGMPNDKEILFHVFNLYLELKEPYAIPPLIPIQGDIFKFLLVYVYNTPELKHWNVFPKNILAV